MWNYKWKQERQPVLLVPFCFSSHLFLPTSPLWTPKNAQGIVAVFGIKEDASPSLFPKLFSRSHSFNSNANAGIAAQNEDSKANDSVYILLSCIIGDRNCYTSATTSQTGQMFFVMHTAVTYNPYEFPWVSFWQCGKTVYESLMNYVSAHFCWTKTLFKL